MLNLLMYPGHISTISLRLILRKTSCVGSMRVLMVAVAINAALFVSLLIDTIRSGSPATWIIFLSVLAGSFALTAWLRRGR